MVVATRGICGAALRVFAEDVMRPATMFNWAKRAEDNAPAIEDNAPLTRSGSTSLKSLSSCRILLGKAST
jgi:hypothetical protein